MKPGKHQKKQTGNKQIMISLGRFTTVRYLLFVCLFLFFALTTIHELWNQNVSIA